MITTCSSDYIRAFVLQFMPNGSLENWLYKEDHHLNLHQRVTVMLDAAMAVEYLHHGHVTPIVHCDLKPANVLLDEDMVAHVVDFGISKILAISKSMAYTETLGTLGYIAPGIKNLLTLIFFYHNKVSPNSRSKKASFYLCRIIVVFQLN